MEKKINDFIIFCIELYKFKENLTGQETYELFEKYKIIDYLHDGYDMLHTQGEGWLMDDIDEYLRIRGYVSKV